jgi:hypothetical protein
MTKPIATAVIVTKGGENHCLPLQLGYGYITHMRQFQKFRSIVAICLVFHGDSRCAIRIFPGHRISEITLPLLYIARPVYM